MPAGHDISAVPEIDFLPWRIEIPLWPTATANSGWSTISGADAQYVYAQYLQTVDNGSTTRSVEWDVVMAAGVWTIELIHLTRSDHAIYTFSIDGVDVGTIDGYSSGSANNVRSQIAGVAIASTGKKRLKIRTGTKNASSSAYWGRINALYLVRTA